MERILIIGANGQIGSELAGALAERHGAANVIAADIAPASRHGAEPGFLNYLQLDVLDRPRIARLVADEQITQVYQLAALLSASGEQQPLKAWQLNMDGLLGILELARERQEAGKPFKLFWPSSIAAFGPRTPRDGTPQHAIMDPASIYGISKLAGERLCEYYHQRYGVDVRSIRYPGIISYKAPPGGGTTDYAIAIFHAALRGETYDCFLAADQTLPMLYMPDAIRATLELMDAPGERLGVRSSYNVAGISFSPRELAAAIQAVLPAFAIRYAPDARQQIAAGWPHSIDDSQARADWGWQARIGLEGMVRDMLDHIDAGASQPA